MLLDRLSRLFFGGFRRLIVSGLDGQSLLGLDRLIVNRLDGQLLPGLGLRRLDHRFSGLFLDGLSGLFLNRLGRLLLNGLGRLLLNGLGRLLLDRLFRQFLDRLRGRLLDRRTRQLPGGLIGRRLSGFRRGLLNRFRRGLPDGLCGRLPDGLRRGLLGDIVQVQGDLLGHLFVHRFGQEHFRAVLSVGQAGPGLPAVGQQQLAGFPRRIDQQARVAEILLGGDEIVAPHILDEHRRAEAVPAAGQGHHLHLPGGKGHAAGVDDIAQAHLGAALHAEREGRVRDVGGGVVVVEVEGLRLGHLGIAVDRQDRIGQHQYVGRPGRRDRHRQPDLAEVLQRGDLIVVYLLLRVPQGLHLDQPGGVVKVPAADEHYRLHALHRNRQRVHGEDLAQKDRLFRFKDIAVGDAGLPGVVGGPRVAADFGFSLDGDVVAAVQGQALHGGLGAVIGGIVHAEAHGVEQQAKRQHQTEHPPREPPPPAAERRGNARPARCIPPRRALHFDIFKQLFFHGRLTFHTSRQVFSSRRSIRFPDLNSMRKPARYLPTITLRQYYNYPLLL